MHMLSKFDPIFGVGIGKTACTRTESPGSAEKQGFQGQSDSSSTAFETQIKVNNSVPS
jgi:hypothetical protein